MADAHSRLALIDAFKAVASQFIVLHHLAFYGPMSDYTHRLWPDLVAWLSQDARMAVQVFLVVSGFLSARVLAPQGVARFDAPWRLVGSRYIKIVLPYLAALLVAMVCNEVARRWMTHDTIGAPPGLWQFVAHALLLHGLLGLMAALGLASLFHFNRDAAWDDWALYFVGAYLLGVFAYWVGAGSVAPWHAGVAVAAVGLALALDFRERIVLALAVAALLAWAQRGQWLARWPRGRAPGFTSVNEIDRAYGRHFTGRRCNRGTGPLPALSKETFMTPSQTAMSRLGRRLALVTGALALFGAASAVRAQDVYWSVGVHSPGVTVGVSNAPPRPVVVYQQPVYHPRPVVVYPQPVYHPRPVVVYPAAVHPGWGPPPHHWKQGHKNHKHHGHRGRGNDRRGWR